MDDIVTLSQVHDALNLGSDTSHDTELALYVDAVTAHVENRYGTLPSDTYAAVPADLKLAALEDIRGLYQPGQIGPPAAFGAFGIENTDVGPTYRPVRMWPRVDAWIRGHTLPGLA